MQSKAEKKAIEEVSKMTPLEMLETIESYVEMTDETYRAASKALRYHLDSPTGVHANRKPCGECDGRGWLPHR